LNRRAIDIHDLHGSRPGVAVFHLARQLRQQFEEPRYSRHATEIAVGLAFRMKPVQHCGAAREKRARLSQ